MKEDKENVAVKTVTALIKQFKVEQPRLCASTHSARWIDGCHWFSPQRREYPNLRSTSVRSKFPFKCHRTLSKSPTSHIILTPGDHRGSNYRQTYKRAYHHLPWYPPISNLITQCKVTNHTVSGTPKPASILVREESSRSPRQYQHGYS